MQTIQSMESIRPIHTIISLPDTGNRMYITECIRDSLLRGEAPIINRFLYNFASDPTVPEELEHSLQAGLSWGRCASSTVVYTDYGVTSNMEQDIQDALVQRRPVVYRRQVIFNVDDTEDRRNELRFVQINDQVRD